MTAYAIFAIEVIDLERYEACKRLAPPTITAIGVLEGIWAPSRVVILEFPTVKRAREWLASPACSGSSVRRPTQSSSKECSHAVRRIRFSQRA